MNINIIFLTWMSGLSSIIIIMDKWSFLVGLGVGSVGAAVLYFQLARWKAKDDERKTRLSIQGQPTRRVRQLKLYHSFPFRSCRCAWLAEELVILGNSMEVVPVSLHGPEARGLVDYKREVM